MAHEPTVYLASNYLASSSNLSSHVLHLIVPMFWFNIFLDADVDSYKSLKFVGVPNALCLSLLIWIAIFTMRHEEAELSLGKIISSASMMSPGAGGGEAHGPVSSPSDEF